MKKIISFFLERVVLQIELWMYMQYENQWQNMQSKNQLQNMQSKKINCKTCSLKSIAKYEV